MTPSLQKGDVLRSYSHYFEIIQVVGSTLQTVQYAAFAYRRDTLQPAQFSYRVFEDAFGGFYANRSGMVKITREEFENARFERALKSCYDV